jgi:transposase InsO family protein
MYQISHTFHVSNLGRKVRRLIASCDVCRVKHPNRSFEAECRSHIPKAAGELCAVDLYGPLPIGRGGVRYILVCLDVFTKYVKLYALKAATTRACLQKITTDYVKKVVRPKCILSDNGTQFASPTWKEKLAENTIEVRYCPVRRPQANPSERVMR